MVYGSKARGDWHDDSDIDVLVIVNNEAEHVHKTIRRTGQILAVPSCAVPSIMTRTEAEWARLGAMGAGFYKEVMREAVSIL